MGETKTPVLTKETLIPLGVAASIVGGAVGMAFWLASIAGDVRDSQITNVEQAAQINIITSSLNELKLSNQNQSNELLNRLTKIETKLDLLFPESR